jgi:hypothetical protein
MEHRAAHSVNIFLAYRTVVLGKASGYTVIDCVHSEHSTQQEGRAS